VSLSLSAVELEEADCEMVTDLPATVIVALRGPLVVLAATVSVTDALPDPLVREAVIHDFRFVTDQAHPAAVVTPTVWAPPSAVTDSVVGETE
jgi:hypothetical protein